MTSDVYVRQNRSSSLPSLLSMLPSFVWAFVIPPLHIGYRIYLANRMPIMDCDETFNYWEVVHYLLYGSGYQTWEYANTYALRTYAYLWPLVGLARYVYLPFLARGVDVVVPLWVWTALTEQEVVVVSTVATGNGIDDNGVGTEMILHEKVALFILLRATLAVWMAWAEISFGRAIYEQALVHLANGRKSSGNSATTAPPSRSSILQFRLLTCTSLVFEFLLLTSAGMAHASGALLPSSTVMGLWLYAAAAFLRQQNVWFVLIAVIATLAVGWPFGVFIFIPMGISTLIRSIRKNRLSSFLMQIVAITVLVQGTVMAIDYVHYGRPVSPILNILLYNTNAGGDELYGVEPLSYYVKNLLLNFNYVAMVGLAGSVIPFLLWMRWWNDGWALLLPMYLWLAIVAPRPHKEERFLFPIYPCICLGAAVGAVATVDSVSRWLMRRNKEQHTALSIRTSLLVHAVIWSPAVVLSLSRTAALAKYYTAPLLLFSQLETAIQSSWEKPSSSVASPPPVVCTCGEWYRFPSHFFIPKNTKTMDWTSPSVVVGRFGLAPSSFQGQLPQLFTEHGSGPLSSTSMRTFNNRNIPEDGSYTHLQDCDYLVDLQLPPFDRTSCIDTNHNDDDDDNGLDRRRMWRPILSEPFLDAERTTTALHRVLYIPHWHEKAIRDGRITFANFTLYAKIVANDDEETAVV